MSRHKKPRRTLVDLSRVIGPEPLSHLGNLMIRHPQYFRGFFLLIMTAGLQNNNYKQATVSMIILISVRAIGMLLKFGPSLLLNRLKKTAYLAGHRFNVAQKRCAVMDHVDLIWENVYEPEARMLYLPEEIAEQQMRDEKLHTELCKNISALPAWAKNEISLTDETRKNLCNAIEQARPVSCGIECTRNSFCTSLIHAFETDYDRVSQDAYTGLSINAFEDYMCSPILGEHDAFPSQNWAGNRTLASLRNRLKNYAPPAETTFNPSLFPRTMTIHNLQRNIWHTLVSNVITKRTGTAIRKLNKICHSHEISVQTLLWSACTDAAWIDQYSGLREAIIVVRQRILNQAFGETDERAEMMIERLTRSDELLAMHLRARCDFHYCDPSESTNLFADYKALADYPELEPSIQQFMQNATDQLSEFNAWLKAHSDCWEASLSLTEADRMRVIARTIRRLQRFIGTESAEDAVLIEQHGAKLEEALLFYNHDDDLHEAGIPQKLIDLIHRYAHHIDQTTNNLFAIENANALRAVRAAFHANMENVRTTFSIRNADTETQLIETIGEIILQRIDISNEIIEARIHHTICKMQRLLYNDFVEHLRADYRHTRRDRIRQHLETIQTVIISRTEKR